MPIYEYQCKNCNHTLDLLQKMTDPPALTCPHCSQDGLVRLVSAAGFQLKGTGWYVTDFRDKPKANDTSAQQRSDGGLSAKDTSQESTASKATATEATSSPQPAVAKETKASVQSKQDVSSPKNSSEKS